jgi:hypothetical protein
MPKFQKHHWTNGILTLENQHSLPLPFSTASQQRAKLSMLFRLNSLLQHSQHLLYVVSQQRFYR